MHFPDIDKLYFLIFANFFNFSFFLLILTSKIWRTVSGIWKKQKQTKEVVLPPDDPLLLMSATSLAAGIRSGQIRSQDVVKSYISRIKKVQPIIFAVAENRFDRAITEAKVIDLSISSRKIPPEKLREEKPLLGVPFSVKMALYAKDLQCSYRSLQYKVVSSANDATVVAKMKSAGAVSLISSTMQELTSNINSEKYGTTNNPYDISRSAGGSTGGEGAMIAACGSVIGIGTDTLGSIRFPAFFTGIFAHLPSKGLVSNEGICGIISEEANDLLRTGPMCRYAEDLSTCMNILTHSNKIVNKFDLPINFQKLKIYYILDNAPGFLVPSVQPEIKDAIEKAVRYFKKTHGIEAQKVNLSSFRYASPVFFYFMFTNMEHNMSIQNASEVESGLYSIVKKILSGQIKGSSSYLILCYLSTLKFLKSSRITRYSEKLHKDMRHELESILDEDSVLFCPTSYRTALYHGESDLLLIPSLGLTGIFNFLGAPVTQCPTGLDNDGMPIGFQVAGSGGNDSLTIACAKEIEKCFGGYVPPSKAKETLNGLACTDMFGECLRD